MIEITRTGHFATATLSAKDLLEVMVKRPSTSTRDGFLCINLVRLICSRVLKKSWCCDRFDYGQKESDSTVTSAVMKWVGIQVPNIFGTYASANKLEDVIARSEIAEKHHAGFCYIKDLNLDPDKYSTRQLIRIGILKEIMEGSNLPLTVSVSVVNRC